jgi:hypothetical protein
MKLVEQIYFDEHRTDFRTNYIKYRAGRLKHQYWLWNRKRTNKVIDEYDAKILKNCKPGSTAFFASAGYYLKEIWPHIDSIEMHPVVKDFYPDIIFAPTRQDLPRVVPGKYDNFAIVNNRGDHWVSVDGLTQHLKAYAQVLNPGARLFYSFRDTQIHYNRLKIDAEQHFRNWAQSLEHLDFTLVWSDVVFKEKIKDGNNKYDAFENPDTVNGNIKFWFCYKGKPWTIQ